MALLVDAAGKKKAAPKTTTKNTTSSGYTPTGGAKQGTSSGVKASTSSGSVKTGATNTPKSGGSYTPKPATQGLRVGAQGSSYASKPSSGNVAIREYAESRGAKVTWDPTTKTVLINGQRITPTSIQGGVSYASQADIDRILSQYGPSGGRIGTMDVAAANATGKNAPELMMVDNGGGNVTAINERGEVVRDPQAQMSGAIQEIDVIFGLLEGMLAEFRQSSVEAQAAAAAYLQQTLSMIDNLQQQIMSQIQAQMGGDDPGLLAAIGLIRDEVARQQQALLEELNARGVVQSGLYAEMLERLNRNELTQVQQLVGSRLSDLQAQLNNAIMSLAQARIQAMTGYHSQLMQIAAQDRAALAQLGTQVAGLRLQGAQTKLQNEQFQKELQQRYDALRQQYDIARMQDATQRYGIDVGASTQRYGIDVGAQTERYGIDVNRQLQEYLGRLGYDQAIRTANISAAASRYAADRSAESRLRELQLQYELSQRQGQQMDPAAQQELLAMQTQMANIEMENIKKNLKAFRSKAEVEAFIDSMPFMPQVKSYMKAQVRFLNLPDTTPTSSGGNSSTNRTTTPTPITVPRVPAGTYWTPNTRSYVDLFNSFRK